MVYKDSKVTVTAFPTKHAMESYGYRFDTPDRSIVIAGDTSPSEETIKACNGCDVLIHEARAEEMYARLPAERRAFAAKNHAWISWWPEVASSDRPVVLTTGELHSTPDVLQKEIGSRYSGNFVIERDLDVF